MQSCICRHNAMYMCVCVCVCVNLKYFNSTLNNSNRHTSLLYSRFPVFAVFFGSAWDQINPGPPER